MATKKTTTKKKTARKTASKKKASAKKTQPATDSSRTPLKRICQKLDIDPKNARVKLRRAIRNGDLKFRDVDGSRWDLTKKQAEQVEAILSGE